jgi:hypothetical protein
MAPKQKITKTRQQINALSEKNELANLIQSQNRARSISVGPATGGMIEFLMRGDHSQLWYAISPVEAIEFMQQIASSAGVEIAIRPRQDFAAWRSWDANMPAATAWKGAAPWQLSEEGRKSLVAHQSGEIHGILPASVKEEVEEKVEEPAEEEAPKPKRTRKTNVRSK